MNSPCPSFFEDDFEVSKNSEWVIKQKTGCLDIQLGMRLPGVLKSRFLKKNTRTAA